MPTIFLGDPERGPNLRDLVDLARLQEIQDTFAHETGIAMITVDSSGTPVTQESQFSALCQFLRRDPKVRQLCYNCDAHGGFYLGSIGGPAARLALDCIKSQEVIEYPELGMEAIWKIEVQDFPAFIVVDDKGNDFFTDPSGTVDVPISGIRIRSKER